MKDIDYFVQIYSVSCDREVITKDSAPAVNVNTHVQHASRLSSVFIYYRLQHLMPMRGQLLSNTYSPTETALDFMTVNIQITMKPGEGTYLLVNYWHQLFWLWSSLQVRSWRASSSSVNDQLTWNLTTQIWAQAGNSGLLHLRPHWCIWSTSSFLSPSPFQRCSSEPWWWC